MNKDITMQHLGEVLLLLAELHPDYQSDAFVNAMKYFNDNNPNEKLYRNLTTKHI